MVAFALPGQDTLFHSQWAWVAHEPDQSSSAPHFQCDGVSLLPCPANVPEVSGRCPTHVPDMSANTDPLLAHLDLTSMWGHHPAQFVRLT